MKQPSINSVSSLIRVGGLVSAGLQELGEALELQAVTHTSFSADLAAFVLADDVHTAGKEPLATNRAAVKTAQRNVQNFLRSTRDAMKPSLGYEQSDAWGTLGFVNSFIVPRSATKFVPMMGKVRAYLVANPTKEAPTMGVTGALATATFNAHDAAEQALKDRELAQTTARQKRDSLARGLRRKIRLLIAELNDKLPPVDARWERFGLSQPGILQRPGQAGTPTLTAIGGKDAMAKWDRVPRAQYYRVFVKVIGVDEEAKHVGNASDTSFTLENLPLGVVEVSFSAANNGGEGLRGPGTTITIV